MTGVYVNEEIAATNGHRLVWQKTTGIISEPILIPRKVAKLCSSLISVEVAKLNEYYSFKNNECEVIFKAIDERYPDYKSVIPTDSNLIFSVNRKALIESLTYADISANPITHLIKLGIDKDLTVSSENIDYNSEYSGSLPCNVIKPVNELFEIGVNNLFFLDILKHFDTELVTFGMSTQSRGFLINDSALLMPMILGGYK